MSHTPNTFAGEFDMLAAEKAAIELIINRKLRIEELCMIPQLMRCKSDDAVRLLMKQRSQRRFKGTGHRRKNASVGIDTLAATNAA